MTRLELLVNSCAAAEVLRSEAVNAKTTDRVLFFLPPEVEQIVWVEACKRVGVIYCCCSPGLEAPTIASRLADLQPVAAITKAGPGWESVVQVALNDFAPLDRAVEVLRACNLGQMVGDVQAHLKKLTMSKAIHISEGLEFLSKIAGHSASPASVQEARASLEHCRLGSTVKMVLESVSVHGSLQPGCINGGYMHRAHRARLQKVVQGHQGSPPEKLVEALWAASVAPVPMEANAPLFVIYTSGSTGAPKGVVHCHGGWVSGIMETMRVVFGATPGKDVMLTVANPGWITGQAYQISAVLTSRTTAVIMSGSPVSPHFTRFADVMSRHKVTIFKAGSTFMRAIMSQPDAVAELQTTLGVNSCLRVATFCAEPVSVAVQRFAMEAITANYINSYWATEHGGIVFSRTCQNLEPNTHTWELPWIFSDVAQPGEPSISGLPAYKSCPAGQKGEVLIRAPYPYMFRVVWGDVDSLRSSEWRGDRQRMLSSYWKKITLDGKQQWVYIQGDFAVKHQKQDEMAFTFHGRSDEVINVNGVRVGTEQVEGAILLDRTHRPGSILGHCVVVGAPENLHGEVPLACVTRAPGAQRGFDDQDFSSFVRLVRSNVGDIPVAIVEVPEIPETWSGKCMRRLLKDIAIGNPITGDVSTLKNPDCLPRIQEAMSNWGQAIKRSAAAAPDSGGEVEIKDSLGIVRAVDKEHVAEVASINAMYGFAMMLVVYRHVVIDPFSLFSYEPLFDPFRLYDWRIPFFLCFGYSENLYGHFRVGFGDFLMLVLIFWSQVVQHFIAALWFLVAGPASGWAYAELASAGTYDSVLDWIRIPPRRVWPEAPMWWIFAALLGSRLLLSLFHHLRVPGWVVVAGAVLSLLVTSLCHWLSVAGVEYISRWLPWALLVAMGAHLGPAVVKSARAFSSILERKTNSTAASVATYMISAATVLSIAVVGWWIWGAKLAKGDQLGFGRTEFCPWTLFDVAVCIPMTAAQVVILRPASTVFQFVGERCLTLYLVHVPIGAIFVMGGLVIWGVPLLPPLRGNAWFVAYLLLILGLTVTISWLFNSAASGVKRAFNAIKRFYYTK